MANGHLFVTASAFGRAAGEQGPEGPVGPAGEDGSMMYAGKGAPGNDIGDAGDYYLNQNSGALYGPKDANGWGDSIIVLKGEDGTNGQNGKDGSVIHSGTGTPAGSLGKSGDFYLDKASYGLYGPKTGSGWGTPINLQGPPGTANVIYSEWATLQHAIRDTLIDGSHLKVSHITAPAVTQDILDNGLIMVYMKFSNMVYALPYISDAGGKPNEINFRSGIGKIPITRFAFDDSGSITIGINLQFRYILIPGGVTAKMRSSFLEDYQVVKQYYGIPD